jgi:serine/threonine protein kinase
LAPSKNRPRSHQTQAYAVHSKKFHSGTLHPSGSGRARWGTTKDGLLWPMRVKSDYLFETEHSAYTNADVAQLCVDDGYILSRRLLPAGQDSELFLITDGTTRRASALDQLNNELRLTSGVDDPSVVRAVALGDYGGQPALRLEDPGGDPLSRAVPETLSVESFLRKSIAISAAVGRVHAQSLLHRALRPANILVNQDGPVAITGFRQAARLGSTTQVVALAFDAGADAMPYISPD